MSELTLSLPTDRGCIALILKIVAALSFVFSLMSVQAAPMPSLPDGLSVYDLAKEDRYRSRSVSDYRLMLGAVLKIDRQVRADRDLRLAGELQQFTWEVARSHEPSEPFEAMREQLQQRGAKFLYQCAGRECGASNIWANDLFRYANLYGRDDSQHYLAAQLDGMHFALYAVRRGNQRVYLHLDLISSEDAVETAWFAPLDAQGYMVLPHWPESPELAVRQLVDWMEQSGASVRLVVHQSGTDTRLAQDESERHAKALRQQLLDAGISPQRVETFGVGNLVPSVLGAATQLTVVIVL